MPARGGLRRRWWELSLPKMLFGANAFEISDIERMNLGAHQTDVSNVTTLRVGLHIFHNRRDSGGFHCRGEAQTAARRC